MVSFENALDTAKSRIARWNDFAGLDEVNLVRDAFLFMWYRRIIIQWQKTVWMC